MTTEQKTNYIIMIPAEGYHFSDVDKNEMYEGFICLSKYDSPENYIEVTKEEAIQIRQQIEEAHKAEYEASLNKN